MAAKYTLDPVAFRRLVLNADFMVAEMAGRADAGAAFARDIAPVYEQGPHPGRYRDGIRSESGRDGGVHHDRAYGIIRATAPESVEVEFGTEHNPAHHTMLTAADVMAGFDA